MVAGAFYLLPNVFTFLLWTLISHDSPGMLHFSILVQTLCVRLDAFGAFTISFDSYYCYNIFFFISARYVCFLFVYWLVTHSLSLLVNRNHGNWCWNGMKTNLCDRQMFFVSFISLSGDPVMYKIPIFTLNLHSYIHSISKNDLSLHTYPLQKT